MEKTHHAARRFVRISFKAIAGKKWDPDEQNRKQTISGWSASVRASPDLECTTTNVMIQFRSFINDFPSHPPGENDQLVVIPVIGNQISFNNEWINLDTRGDSIRKTIWKSIAHVQWVMRLIENALNNWPINWIRYGLLIVWCWPPHIRICFSPSLSLGLYRDDNEDHRSYLPASRSTINATSSMMIDLNEQGDNFSVPILSILSILSIRKWATCSSIDHF